MTESTIQGVKSYNVYALDDAGKIDKPITIINGNSIIPEGTSRVRLIVHAQGDGRQTLEDINAIRVNAGQSDLMPVSSRPAEGEAAQTNFGFDIPASEVATLITALSQRRGAAR